MYIKEKDDFRTMFVRCKFQNCGYCSNSGFCLNRLVVINEQGTCEYLTKPGWEQEIEDRFKNNYKPPIERIEARAPVNEDFDGAEEYIDEIKSIWG